MPDHIFITLQDAQDLADTCAHTSRCPMCDINVHSDYFYEMLRSKYCPFEDNRLCTDTDIVDWIKLFDEICSNDEEESDDYGEEYYEPVTMVVLLCR